MEAPPPISRRRIRDENDFSTGLMDAVPDLSTTFEAIPPDLQIHFDGTAHQLHEALRLRSPEQMAVPELCCDVCCDPVDRCEELIWDIAPRGPYCGCCACLALQSMTIVVENLRTLICESPQNPDPNSAAGYLMRLRDYLTPHALNLAAMMVQPITECLGGAESPYAT